MFVKQGAASTMFAISPAVSKPAVAAKPTLACETSRETPYSGDAARGMPNNNYGDGRPFAQCRWRVANNEDSSSPFPF